MKKICAVIAGIMLLGFGIAAISYGCPWSISQRAYLNRCFWQPFTHYVRQTAKHWRTREPNPRPFAGYSAAAIASTPFEEARSSYRRLEQAFQNFEDDEKLETLHFDAVRKAIENARGQEGLTPGEQDELELLAAKIDLREGITGNKPRLFSAQKYLRAFIWRAKKSPYRSEARGWLACACYNLGQYSEAAKIYMDEFKAADSAIGSESLETSLRLVFRKAKPTLAAHIGEYFDTPEHALLVIQMVSNPIIEGRDPQLIRQNGNAILKEMEKHRQLFAKKENAEKLALAMMRVCLTMGDMERLLQYAKEIPETSKTGKTPDYFWMVGCAHFLNNDFVAAEQPLRNILSASGAPSSRTGKAAMALIGVYERLHRPLDELDAALKWEDIRQRQEKMMDKIFDAKEDDREILAERYLPDGLDDYNELNPLMPFTNSAFDLPLLLDRELTVEQLQQYFDAHPDADRLVPYSLAVRYARQEKYDQAARLYAKAGATVRHQRMLKIQSLYAAVQAHSPTIEELQQKRFDYAHFLSQNSCRVFFNDRLWDGFQTSSFIENPPASMLLYDDEDPYVSPPDFGLTQQERDRIIGQQRQLQDEQEEYWRAYKIFDDIVKVVGPTSLGRKAAREAISCLSRISGRFGRKQEIKSETDRLVKWFKLHRRA
jgi:hypothetical protein